MKKSEVTPVYIIVSAIFAILFFFPILLLFVSSFKEEIDVVRHTLTFIPTLKHYEEIFSGNILHYVTNSLVITFFSIVLAMVLGTPVAYAISIKKYKEKSDNIFFWFISTILLPPVCVIIPIYLVFKTLGILDTSIGLIIVYGGVNTPIVVWMMRSFFNDIPYELVEASMVDGAKESTIFFRIMLPIARNGISATILLIFIFIWNEFFFALSLTYTDAATLPILVSRFMTQEGLFWAKMCAISSIAVLPALLLGWLNQKQLTRGLTMGAVKG